MPRKINRLARDLAADGKLTFYEVNKLIRSAEDGRGVTANEKAALSKLRQRYGDQFTEAGIMGQGNAQSGIISAGDGPVAQVSDEVGHGRGHIGHHGVALACGGVLAEGWRRSHECIVHLVGQYNGVLKSFGNINETVFQGIRVKAVRVDPSPVHFTDPDRRCAHVDGCSFYDPGHLPR